MSIITAWFIGSVPDLAAQTVTIDGSAETLPSDDYYLYNDTAALSLLNAFDLEMQSAGLAGTSVQLLKSGHVKIAASTTFPVVWTSTTLRDLLGFSQGDLSGANNYTADDYSPLFHSPGWPENPDEQAPCGVVGWEVTDTVSGVAADGKSIFTSANDRMHNEFSFFSVPQDRTHTTETGVAGEYYRFWREVLAKGYRWNLHRSVIEDRASGDPVTLGSQNIFGPYKLRPQRSPLTPGHRRERPNNDNLWRYSIPAIEVAEYT